jgi:hypothetical protein
MSDETDSIETPEEKAIRIKKEYTDRLREEYIAAESEKNPDFVFDESLWAGKPAWSDEIEMSAPKNAKIMHMQAAFPPGSAVPYLIAAAIVAIILLVLLF